MTDDEKDAIRKAFDGAAREASNLREGPERCDAPARPQDQPLQVNRWSNSRASECQRKESRRVDWAELSSRRNFAVGARAEPLMQHQRMRADIPLFCRLS
jgi:hypothetical protein